MCKYMKCGGSSTVGAATAYIYYLSDLAGSGHRLVTELSFIGYVITSFKHSTR